MTTPIRTFVPSWKAYKLFVAAIPLSAIVFVAVFVFAQGRTMATILGIFFAGLAIALGYTGAYITRSRVTITDGKLIHRKAIGTKSIALDDGFKGLLVNYEDTTGLGFVSSSVAPVLFLANKKTGARMRIHGAYYQLETLRAIAKLTNSPDLTKTDALRKAMVTYKWDSANTTTKVLSKSHPFYFRWAERYPWRFAAIWVPIGVIVFALGIFIAAAIISPSSIPPEIRQWYTN